MAKKEDYSMFKFFKGETENPFNHETQNRESNWWFYESIFQDMFNKNDTPDWYGFFDMHSMGNEFYKILTKEDYERPSMDKKKPIFELWLEYLFKFKLYPEWGGNVNTYKEDYFSTTAK